MIYAHPDLINLFNATYARGLLAYLEPEAVAEGIWPPPSLTKDERIALRTNLPELWAILKGLEFYERRARIKNHYKLKASEIKINDPLVMLLPIFEQKHGITTFEPLESLAEYMHRIGDLEQLIKWGCGIAPETFKRLNDERGAYYAGIKSAALKLASEGASKTSVKVHDHQQHSINAALAAAGLSRMKLIADLSDTFIKDPALVDLLDDLSPGWESEQ